MLDLKKYGEQSDAPHGEVHFSISNGVKLIRL
jgi:hypothetical protein